MKQVQTIFVYLLRQSLCLLPEKRQILELSSRSFATLILPRPFSSWAFSFIGTFVWDSNMLNVLRSRIKRKDTKMQLCYAHRQYPHLLGNWASQGMQSTSTESEQNPSSHFDRSVKLPSKRSAVLLKLNFDSL